jgi:hypothetical protein
MKPHPRFSLFCRFVLYVAGLLVLLLVYTVEKAEFIYQGH